MSDTDVVDINNHRHNRGVDQIDFDTCFDADINWWKDGKSTAKHFLAKTHPEIDDCHRHVCVTVCWFSNGPGTPTMTILTSPREHTAKTCVCD